jgi:competence protein ComEC
VRVLPVGGSSSESEQELALLASLDGQDFLLTGDMSAAKERRMLKNYELPDIEILVAGHHGSKYSTTEDILEQLAPEYVCISVGSNSYGHPTEETLQRLAEHGCTVYRTDLHGNIHLPMNEGEAYGTGDEKTQ